MSLCSQLLNGGHYMITGCHAEVRYNSLSKMRNSQLVYIIHLATGTGNCAWQMNKRSIFRDLLWPIYKSETSNEVWKIISSSLGQSHESAIAGAWPYRVLQSVILSNSFFIHSIFVQTLSDMCVLLSPVRQGAAIQPRGWMCVTRLHVWLSRRPVIEWTSRTWHEPGGSADPSISDSVRLELGAMIC